MSVFGGDSWSRDAQNRKRRVDDLFISGRSRGGSASSANSYKKLSNGKFACLVCPNSPILDTPLMLSVHCKGSRHVAAEIRLKELELLRSEELKKRIALSSDYDNSKSSQNCDKPLIEQTRKAIVEMQSNKAHCSSSNYKGHNIESSRGVSPFEGQSCSPLNANFEPSSDFRPNWRDISKAKSPEATEIDWNSLLEQEVEFCKRREKELKFIAAGWKRDSHGKWYRDENAEFDSDEEDPNVVLE